MAMQASARRRLVTPAHNQPVYALLAAAYVRRDHLADRDRPPRVMRCLKRYIARDLYTLIVMNGAG